MRSGESNKVWKSSFPLAASLCVMFALQFGCEKSENAVGTTPPTELLTQPNARAVPPGLTGTQEAAGSEHGIWLVDFTAKSQIDFVHHYDGKGEMYLAEPVASGMATLDFDRDGWIDLYFLNGAPIPANLSETQPNALCRNLGGMQFSDVTTDAQVGNLAHSVGVAVGDFDGDGFADIFVNNFGPNALFRNNGDGTFADVTEWAGVSGSGELGAGACFMDANADGLLDLYVGNYVQQPVEANIKRTTDGYPSYPGPLDFLPEFDFFFRNEGDGTFSDQSQASGVAGIATTSMGVIAGDFNDDGDTDIIVVNDVERNLYYDNNGAGEFDEIGIQTGVAFSLDAQRNGNMGIDSADYDNDGYLDLFTTTFSHDSPVLYRNDGNGNFLDVTQATGAGRSLFSHANWGTVFFDAENDGDKDLMIANGHTDPHVNKWAHRTDWKVANSLMLNANGRFTDISETCGDGFLPVESSRGAVADDLDNDGDVDIVVLNALCKPTVIRNESPNSGNWLQLELHGQASCRDAIGTKVSFEIAGKKYVDEVRGGRGYQSSYGQRLSFGLGKATIVEHVSIRWQSGSTQHLSNIAANQLLVIVEGRD
jgi:enediyne biosynthesis protein E4